MPLSLAVLVCQSCLVRPESSSTRSDSDRENTPSNYQVDGFLMEEAPADPEPSEEDQLSYAMMASKVSAEIMVSIGL